MQVEPQPRYQFFIDRGGTFTDCILRDTRDQSLRATKILSSDSAPLEGMRRLLGLGEGAPIPPAEIRMGTTLATNALLERKGTPCAFVVSRGFADLLAIGDQSRPHLFDLEIEKPVPLPTHTVEADGRLSASGELLAPLDEAVLSAELERLSAHGLRSLAVALMHSYLDDAGERRVAQLAAAAGFDHVSLSHEISGELGLLGRSDTTTADAYLTPLIRGYVRGLLEHLPGSTLRIMQSNGGLLSATRFRGRDAVLSGPAAGVVGAASVARDFGLEQIIGFDMGGTSTDVSRFDGDYRRVFEAVVAGVRIRAPMIAIHTVAAGGGSICRLDGRRLVVGPESAGADPGPLCYGRASASELTLTDVALVLGRVLSDEFPFQLHVERAEYALDRVVEQLASQGVMRSREQVAEGFMSVAVENMAAAIREVSVARGYDVRDHAMVVFGGAGGQYACRIARRLGIKRLLFHPYASALSAFGMGVAPVAWHGERDAGRQEVTEATKDAWVRAFDDLEQLGRASLSDEASEHARWTVRRELALRYRGTETSLDVPSGTVPEMKAAFERRHLREFGYVRPGHPIDGVTLRLTVEVRTWEVELPPVESGTESPAGYGEVWLAGSRSRVPVFRRDTLATDHEVAGPALVVDPMGIVVVEEGFVAVRDPRGYVVLEDIWAKPLAVRVEPEPDPVLLEVFNNLFMSIAEQMGAVLRRTALSTNIRDRLDFSCAVFDRDGGLIANAPHIPVHLGAMGESVRAVLRSHPHPSSGEVFVTNDPADGGSHLPDLTVVTPVHDEAGDLRFFVASRGHHADIGGTTPGSMPPFSIALEQEGAVLRNEKIVADRQFDEDKLRELLTRGPHPARNPDENVADIQAQIASNEKGVQLLRELIERYGLNVVESYMQHVQDNAADLVATAIGEIPDGQRIFSDELDDGARVAVTLTISGQRMTIDFSGTAKAQDNNLNAPRAVTMAAVLYVLRTLVGRRIPLNSGCLRPVKVHIPDGSLLSPEPDRAVAAGNVETSQRIVDVLLGALGLAAASQGTMNNLTFGTSEFGYYETLGGGAGATPDANGASGVHTHMTNSRVTDPEILESRFPIRVRRFGIRRGSGGAGTRRGGDGLVRELEFLAPMHLSIISQRRTLAPYGVDGGQPGASGVNRLNDEVCAGTMEADVSAGDLFTVLTPGGGGWGAPEGGR